jgi:sulfur carrier protein
MQVLVNGKPLVVAAPLSVADLLKQLSLAGKRVAVERNGDIVPKSLHATTHLSENDRLEIVVAVGGG